MTKPFNEAPVNLSMTLDDLTAVLAALRHYGNFKARTGLDSADIDGLYDRLTEDAWSAAADHARNEGVTVEGDEYDWDGKGF